MLSASNALNQAFIGDPSAQESSNVAIEIESNLLRSLQSEL